MGSNRLLFSSMVIAVFVVGGAGIGLSSCEQRGAANKHVEQLLEKKGYTKVEIGGAWTAWGSGWGWGCSDSDYHLVEFSAVNAAGNTEEGMVCCGRLEPIVGYTKGCTIRN